MPLQGSETSTKGHLNPDAILFLATLCAILVGRESRSQEALPSAHFANSPTRSVRSEDAETTARCQVSLVALSSVAMFEVLQIGVTRDILTSTCNLPSGSS